MRHIPAAREAFRLWRQMMFGKNARKRRNGLPPLRVRFVWAWRMAGCGWSICLGPPYRGPRYMRRRE